MTQIFSRRALMLLSVLSLLLAVAPSVLTAQGPPAQGAVSISENRSSPVGGTASFSGMETGVGGGTFVCGGTWIINGTSYTALNQPHTDVLNSDGEATTRKYVWSFTDANECPVTCILYFILQPDGSVTQQFHVWIGDHGGTPCPWQVISGWNP